MELNTNQDLDRRLAQDVAEYLGVDWRGPAVKVVFEGYDEEWGYSTYTGGVDHFIRATITFDATHSHRRDWHTEEEFDMAAFLRWVYAK